MNRAKLSFRYTAPINGHGLVLLASSDDCYKCSPLPQWPQGCEIGNSSCLVMSPNTNYSFDVDAKFPSSILLQSDQHIVWQSHYKFKELSDYSMLAQQVPTGEVHASIELVHEASPAVLLPIVLALLSLWLISGFVRFFWHKYLLSLREDDEEADNLQPLLEAQQLVSPLRRIVCLDVFRGITIFTMIFVNYGGGDYWFFNHSTWNGLTVADLCFPWFAWIMGATMAISYEKKLKNRKEYFYISSIRSLKLLLLGLFLNNGYDLANWRIPGVLQSFGAAYWMVSMILLISTTLPLRQSFLQWALMLVVVGLQSFLVFALPIPGCPTGYFGAGGLAEHSSYPNCTGGAHKQVDIWIFGPNHIYQYPTTKAIYRTGAYDPEGFLNWIMVAFTTFLGFKAGVIFLNGKDYKHRSGYLSFFGLILGIFAWIGCQGRLNDGWIPVNKNLWSLTFVLSTSSLACLLLAFLFLYVDTFDMWTGSPFLQTGMNPIILYLGHELLQDHFPFGFKHGSTSHSLSMASSLFGALCWLAIAQFLYRRKIFITV
ncbi:heparan-alpha-glucosaminide N-acetyltransferase [Thraustotheca clavata]|uniref:Heparan-alpha-glucosaminide N-acetyltransferase n=1 Tax=Thraustotheca clavata TaxID=74557 RepID=A0A1V9ZJY2_9STRA|nr:heparan-alpha-glucosaminide N-acetyltransferase [Thraustotheca clavata]